MITFATESKSEYSTSARFFRCLFIRVWIFSLSKYFSVSLQWRSRYGRWAPGFQSKHLRHPTNKGKHFTVATLAAPESVRLNVGLVCVETVFVLTFPLSPASFHRLPQYISNLLFCISPETSVSLSAEDTSVWFDAKPAVLSPWLDCSEVTFAGATPVAEDGLSPFSQSGSIL